MDKIILSPIELSDLMAAFKKMVDDSIAAAEERLNNKPGDDEPLTQKQLAKFLNVSDQTLIRWRHKKRIPVKFIGTSPRYILKDVLKALDCK